MCLCAFVLLQFAKFRQLLKDAIFLNDRLRKYVEKRSLSCDERNVDHSDNLAASDSAELHRSDDANTAGAHVSHCHQTGADNSAERCSVSVRIASSHQQHSLSSSTAASRSAAESSAVISQQELVKLQVTCEYILEHACLFCKLLFVLTARKIAIGLRWNYVISDLVSNPVFYSLLAGKKIRDFSETF